MQKTYWSQKGKYQTEMDTLHDQLVPEEGRCETVHGELLRAAGSLYYDVYNNAYLNKDNLTYKKSVLFEHESDLISMGLSQEQWATLKYGFSVGKSKNKLDLFEDTFFIEAMESMIDCTVLYCKTREKMKNCQ